MSEVKRILVALFIIISAFSQAQNNENSPRIEDMHNHKWQFLVEQSHLTTEEAQKVQPVFMNYEKTIWKMHQQNREYFKSTYKNAKKIKPDYAKLNDNYVNFEFKQAQLLKNYHNQLRKLLDPETLYNYYKAEREFKRKLLQDFHDRRPQERSRPQ